MHVALNPVPCDPTGMAKTHVCVCVCVCVCQVLIPLKNSDIEHQGPLTAIMQMRGEFEGVYQMLEKDGLGDIRVEFPAPPGEALAIAL